MVLPLLRLYIKANAVFDILVISMSEIFNFISQRRCKLLLMHSSLVFHDL